MKCKQKNILPGQKTLVHDTTAYNALCAIDGHKRFCEAVDRAIAMRDKPDSVWLAVVEAVLARIQYLYQSDIEGDFNKADKLADKLDRLASWKAYRYIQLIDRVKQDAEDFKFALKRAKQAGFVRDSSYSYIGSIGPCKTIRTESVSRVYGLVTDNNDRLICDDSTAYQTVVDGQIVQQIECLLPSLKTKLGKGFTMPYQPKMWDAPMPEEARYRPTPKDLERIRRSKL